MVGLLDATPFPLVGISKRVDPSAATAVANVVGCVTVDDTFEMCGCRCDLIADADWPRLEAAAAATEAS